MPALRTKNRNPVQIVRNHLNGFLGARPVSFGGCPKTGEASLINYKLSDTSRFRKTQTFGSAAIASGVRISVGPERGQIIASPGKALRLQFDELAPHAGTEWIELACELHDKLWLGSAQIHLRFVASAEASTSIRPAARIIYKEGFHDRFAGDPHILTSIPQSYGTSFDLPPNLMVGAVRIDLHLFFEMLETSLLLHDLTLTGIG